MKFHPFRWHRHLFGILLSVCLAGLTKLTTKAQSSKNWQYIRTQHYDIYFLKNIGHEAQRVANALEGLYIPLNKTLQTQPARRSVMLISEAAISNGATPPPLPLAIAKIKLYTYPPERHELITNIDWLNTLALHEFRHVAQFASLVEHYHLIQPMWVTGPFFTPKWLSEGDAVGIETALSAGGRGRVPSFLTLYKVNLLERGGFSYRKNLYNSLKDNVPDYYRLGYVMTTHLRRHYGPDIIRNIMERKGFVDFFNPWAVEYKIKKYTGRTVQQIFNDTNKELKELWTHQLKDLPITPFQTINKRESEDYVDYFHPHLTSNGKTVVLLYSLTRRPYFAYLNEKGEATFIAPTLITKGIANIPFTLAKDKLYWIERKIPQVWEKVQLIQYNTIQSYDLTDKTYRTIVPAGRYKLVVASPDGTKLAAVETDTNYHHRIVILEAETGDVIKQLENPRNNHYLTPTWSPDGEQLVTIRQEGNKTALTLLTIKTGKQTDVLPLGQEIIHNPVIHPPYVYYCSAFSGIDNIYAINILTKERFQVTSSQYGASNPIITADGNTMLYNDFGKYGMEAVKIPLNPSTWTPFHAVEDRSIHYYAPIVEQEGNADILENLPQEVYPVYPFDPDKKFGFIVSDTTLIIKNFSHTLTWIPISLKGSTLLPPLKAIHDTDEKTKFIQSFINPVISTELIYKGWYPIVSVKATCINLLDHLIYKGEKSLARKLRIVTKPTIRLPFYWSDKGYKYTIAGRESTRFLNIKHTDRFRLHVEQIHNLQLIRKLPKGYRDRFNPWRQSISLTYTHPLYNFKNDFHQIKLKLLLYFPGLLPNHSLQLKYVPTYRQEYIPKPIMIKRQHQGLLRKIYAERERFNQAFGVSYALPLYYPDLTLMDNFYLRALWFSIGHETEIRNVSRSDLLKASASAFSHYNIIHLIADFHWFNISVGANIYPWIPFFDIV